MAALPISFIFLCLLLPTILAVAEKPQSWPWQCECPEPCETRLHMYLHQFPAWPNVSNANEVAVISTPPPIGFGQMYVDDWFLTIGPDPNEKIVGRAQGFHIQAGQTRSSWYISHIFVFQDDSYAGSTLQVLGTTADPGNEWSIIGGTGTFTNAHGNIKYKNVKSTTSSITDVVMELDIHVFYTPETST